MSRDSQDGSARTARKARALIPLIPPREPLRLVAQPGKHGAPLNAESAPSAATDESEASESGPESGESGTEVAQDGAATVAGSMRFGAHDVKQLVEECNTLLVAIGQRGAVVDQQRVRAVAESFAAIRLLVMAGICTEQEAQGEVYAAMRGVLATTLQSVEVARLKAQAAQQGPVTVKRPPLIVAKH